MSSTISAMGSDNANEYARKRREQIENAKRMREERKSGVLKSVGE